MTGPAYVHPDDKPSPDEYEETPASKLCSVCHGFAVLYNPYTYLNERCTECRGTGRNDT